MNEHLISVIIPVYNTAEYLPRCLDSILNNTYKHLEILCINDGSRDNSLEVLNAYAAQDSRIRVIDQENAGVSAARNRGLDEATGEYIAFVDSDDWVHRQYFEVLLKAVCVTHADISICDTPEVSHPVEDVSIALETLSAEPLSDIPYFHKSLGVWGRLYHRRVFGQHRFDPKVRLAEDTLFNLHIFQSEHYALRLSYCNCPMYYYFMREDSAVHTLYPGESEPLLNWYVSNLDTAPSRIVRNYFLIFSMKRLFVWRLHATVMGRTEDVKRSQFLLSLCKQKLKKTSIREFKAKWVFLLFVHFPSLYRLFRIVTDPTMLNWEKQYEKVHSKRT